ncbi:MAG TPA: hypothetical protein HPP58_04790 [Deltaproteobacteria bacterium]|nr:hypothetical protein [Deltaproteobacteria bacterium]HIJ42231.1 hypothetical protein [Deltaproteobacteria bacterium]
MKNNNDARQQQACNSPTKDLNKAFFAGAKLLITEQGWGAYAKMAR